MMMMMMNYLGAARLNKVFKSFHLPFWQTNACNAELPTQTLNIVKLKFGFDSIFWPTHAMREGFDLFIFSLSWSCCTKSISCSSFSLVISIHKGWPTKGQYEQVADRTIGQCETNYSAKFCLFVSPRRGQYGSQANNVRPKAKPEAEALSQRLSSASPSQSLGTPAKSNI